MQFNIWYYVCYAISLFFINDHGSFKFKYSVVCYFFYVFSLIHLRFDLILLK